MDFDSAVKAHSAWKQKLANYIEEPDGSLEAGLVSRDDRCELGQWLHGEGRSQSSTTYEDLLTAHAGFHRCAGDLVDRINRGDRVDPEVSLGATSEFGRRSLECITLIVSMKRLALGIAADGLGLRTLRNFMFALYTLIIALAGASVYGLVSGGHDGAQTVFFAVGLFCAVGGGVGLGLGWRVLAADIRRRQELESQNEATMVRESAENAEMAAKVDSLLAAIGRAAEGDLNVEVEVRGTDPLGRLGSGVGKLLVDLRSNIRRIAGSSETLAAAAEELQAVSQQMGAAAAQSSSQAHVASDAASGVATDVNSATHAADELSMSISEIAQSAASATDVARAAVVAARDMEHDVARLRASSQEIGDIVQTITSIAEQTNLLALNATIEAARAGEAGAGFAVVANEVKELANATARATDDIARKVDMIRSATEDSTATIARIVGTIDQIAEIQTTIASAVEEQAAVTSEIARSMTNAEGGMSSISTSITEVASATGAAATGARDTAQASEELSKMAGDLRELVDAFTF